MVGGCTSYISVWDSCWHSDVITINADTFGVKSSQWSKAQSLFLNLPMIVREASI